MVLPAYAVVRSLTGQREGVDLDLGKVLLSLRRKKRIENLEWEEQVKITLPVVKSRPIFP